MPPKRKQTAAQADSTTKPKAVEEAPTRPKRNRVVTSYNEDYSDEAPKTTKAKAKNAGDAKPKPDSTDVKVKGKRGRKKKVQEEPEDGAVKPATSPENKVEKEDEVDEEPEEDEPEKPQTKDVNTDVKVKGKRGRKKKVVNEEVEDDAVEVNPKNKVEVDEEPEKNEAEIKPENKLEKQDEIDDDDDVDDVEEVKSAKGRKKKDDTEEKPKKNGKGAVKAAPKNKTATAYDEINFNDCTRKNENGKEWNFKISNWNVDGLRAWINKGGLEYIQHEKPDIFCLQETKCSEDKLPPEAKEVDGYKVYWICSEKDGYAGVGLYTKIEPISVQYGLNDEEHDNEGRMITAEFDKFYVVSVYVPNSGRGLVTLPKRLKWNEAFRKFVAELDKKKPVIVCGDMNVSHLEIDLSNPKTNTKNAGFTKEERDGMTEFLSDGYVDTFRNLYPDKTQAYTFWTYMANCRAKNIGWRLDYFIVSKRFMENVCDNMIRNQVFGSDHCPITLFLNI